MAIQEKKQLKSSLRTRREKITSFIGKIIVFFRGGNFLIRQSATYLVSPLISTDEREFDIGRELADTLVKKGYIKISHKIGKDHGKESITVTAKINVKP